MKPVRDLSLGVAQILCARLFRIKCPRIVLACMPKSASTFLATCVASLPGMRAGAISYSAGHREQVIDLSRLSTRALRGFVAQQHLRYSEYTGKILDEFRITPVVLVRNLFDAVASLRDHVRKESPEMPMMQIVGDPRRMSDDELELAIADLAMPWYFNFYIGWLERHDALWVHFDEVRTSPNLVLNRIVERAKIKATPDDVEAAVQRGLQAKPRFNRGVPGRGTKISARARERIFALAAHYPSIDFSPIGLPPPRSPEALRPQLARVQPEPRWAHHEDERLRLRAGRKG